MYASDHTRLMNKFIGLCSNVSDWPSVLYELGYRIKLVEQKISTETDSVTPDIVVMSNRLSHSLVVDCKSGSNIDHGQDDRYKGIKPAHLFTWIDVRERPRFKFSTCYAVNDTNYGKLSTHTNFPFVVFGSEFVEGEGDFGHDDLNLRLCKRTSLLNKQEPRLFYPFSVSDDDHLVLQYTMTGILAWIGKKRLESFSELARDETLSNILMIIHPQHKYMGERHRNDLRNRMKKALETVLDRDDFKLIKKSGQEGRMTASTLQNFGELCREIVEEQKVRTTLD